MTTTLDMSWQSSRLPADNPAWQHRPAADTAQFSIGGKTYYENDPAFQEALGSIYGTQERPRCMCVSEGVEMYVSRFSSFVVKRMPETGHKHDPSCDSFEPEATGTGKGLHIGEAISVQPSGRIQVRLNFPLTRYEGRAATHSVAGTHDVAQGEKGSLSISALLHLLWEEAGFNKWSPKMEGKRNWGLVRHFLLRAANEIDAKGSCLADQLLIPESFRSDRKAEIAERLRLQLAKLESTKEAVSPLLVCIGVVKDLEETGSGSRVVLKHLSEVPLSISDNLMKKMKRNFGAAIEAAQTDERLLLILACTVCKNALAKRYAVDTATLMIVNQQWIPVDNRFERTVADALIAGRRSFMKVLRYGAAEKYDYANFLLRDAGDGRVPLDIVFAGMSKEAVAAKESALSERAADSWIWRAGQSMQMPPLPPATRLKSAQPSQPR